MTGDAEVIAGQRRRHKMRNLVQSTVLLVGMAGILAICAWSLVGPEGAMWVLAGGIVGMVLSPRLSSATVMRFFGARHVGFHDLAAVYRRLDRICRRAGLPQRPELYLLRGRHLNAFAVGSRDDPAIAITYGMLRVLTLRELLAVLAHEVSHIANNDIWVMQLADTISRFTRIMSIVGIAMAVVSLPLALIGEATIPLPAVVLLIFAPTLSGLLQFALSRTREYDADLYGAALLGDAHSLASALRKIDQLARPVWRQVLLPGGGDGEPSLLRSHPPTSERIRRLERLAPIRAAASDESQTLIIPAHVPLPGRRRFWW